MIANWGWDPLTTAVAIGGLTFWLPAFFRWVWNDWAIAQALNFVLVFSFAILGWGFTSYPWIWPLILTMTTVAYGVNQFGSNLFVGLANALRPEPEGSIKSEQGQERIAALDWLPLEEKETND